MLGSVSLVVIGGGQAGLAVSRQLMSLGVDHVVLDPSDARYRERGRLDVERVRGSRIGRDRSYPAYAFTRKEPLDSISIDPRLPFDDRHVPSRDGSHAEVRTTSMISEACIKT